MTEAEARRLLRDSGGFGGLEAWIAVQLWTVAPGGWAVARDLQGWRFRMEPVKAGLRLTATAPEPEPSDPAVWIVR